MARFSWRRTPVDLSARGRSPFAVINPSRHLQSVSQSGSQPIGEYQPPSPKGHEWQRDAFAYNELIPEVGFLHDLTAKLVATCNLVVNEIDPETDRKTVSTDPKARRVMRVFIGPVGGTKELKRRAALHLQIAGESLLLATPLKDERGDDQGISWEFLSPEEVKVERKRKGTEEVTIIKRNSGGESDGEVEVEAHVSRFYRPDPRFSGRADSPMKRLLPLCRELIVLSEVVGGVAKSRLSSGLLYVPDEMSFGAEDETADQGNEVSPDDIDQFIADLIEHMRAPIEDRSSAAGLVPLVVTGPAEFSEALRQIPLVKDMDTAFQALRGELLDRIAMGLDAPPEIIQGKANLNHWSAYSVDSDLVSRHVAPLGEMLAEFLTIAMLRPMLIRHEDMDPADADRYVLVFDPSPLAQQTDEVGTATTGYNMIIVSDAAWLARVGLTEADMPTPEERKRRFLEKCLLGNPALMAQTLLPLLYPEDAALIDALEKMKPINAAPEFGPGNPGGASVPVPSGPSPVGPPHAPPTDRPPGNPPTSLDSLVDRLAVAGAAALDRALERAGSKIVTRCGQHPTLRARFKDLPKQAIMASMSDLDYRALRVTQNELLVDAWESLAGQAEGWIQEWALATGAPDELATKVGRSAALQMVRVVDALARSGAPVSVPGGMSVPLDLIRACIASAAQELAAAS